MKITTIVSNQSCYWVFKLAVSIPPRMFSYFVSEVILELTWLFQLVGNDTTDKVRLCAPQSCHQVVQLFLWGEISKV